MANNLVICLVAISLFSSVICYQDQDLINHEHESHAYEGHFVNEFAVEVDGNTDVADLVANTHGFNVVKRISGLGNIYLFQHDTVSGRAKRSAVDLVDKLKTDPNVRYVEQQRILKRTKRTLKVDDVEDVEVSRYKRTIVHDKQWELPIREYKDKTVYQRYLAEGAREAKDGIPGENAWINEMGFNDPYYRYQWYLSNYGQTGGKKGYDLNVLPAWKKGFTGKGVSVSILDDGVDHSHPDLHDNYDPEASADLNDKSDQANDPMPNTKISSNSHGTRCAGEVAAKSNNKDCGVGIAYNAKIGGVRMLDGTVTDMLEADALTYNNQHIKVFSASWGPSDDGRTMEGPHHYAAKAMEKGVKEGRGGLGSIYVWATGNGGVVDDTCSCDGYVSSIYTLSIGSISDKGMSTYYSEVCPSTMACAFTGGSHVAPGNQDYENPQIKVVTTDLNGDCTMEFQGTSSAAPLAAGCVALLLEANPNVGWRDVQNIVVETARIPNNEEDGWMINGGGYHVNHKFGFGVLDCGKMVEVAQTWVNVAEQHTCDVPPSNEQVDIVYNEWLNQTLAVNSCPGDQLIDRLEHVQLHLDVAHDRRGALTIWLTSPSGTSSNILAPRPLDDTADGIDFTFMTVHCWGEDPRGEWTLSILDHSNSGSPKRSRGTLKSWSLTLWGVEGPNPNAEAGQSHSSREDNGKRAEAPAQAHAAPRSEINSIMDREGDDASQVEDNIKTTGQKRFHSNREFQGWDDIDMQDVEAILKARGFEDSFVNVNQRELIDEERYRDEKRRQEELEDLREKQRLIKNIEKLEELIERLDEAGIEL